jgi:hypothetical protein
MFFLLDNCNLKKKCKKVSFYTIVNVSLIPCINELCSFKQELWWSENDYISFFHSSTSEIREFSKKHPNMSFENAKKILYQPSYVYDDLFFEKENH